MRPMLHDDVRSIVDEAREQRNILIDFIRHDFHTARFLKRSYGKSEGKRMAPHTAGGTRIIDFHRARKDAYTIACGPPPATIHTGSPTYDARPPTVDLYSSSSSLSFRLCLSLSDVFAHVPVTVT